MVTGYEVGLEPWCDLGIRATRASATTEAETTVRKIPARLKISLQVMLRVARRLQCSVARICTRTATGTSSCDLEVGAGGSRMTPPFGAQRKAPIGRSNGHPNDAALARDDASYSCTGVVTADHEHVPVDQLWEQFSACRRRDNGIGVGDVHPVRLVE